MRKTALAVASDEQPAKQLLRIPHSRIEPNPDQPRRWFDQDLLVELSYDIESRGQDTPVKVRPNPGKPGWYILIGGERRWRAFGHIAKRNYNDPLMDAILDDSDMSDEERFDQAFLDNHWREDLIPVDLAAGYLRMYRKSTAPSHAATVAEIAKRVGKSASHVDGYLLINGLPPQVKELMDPARKEKGLPVLVPTTAIDIARSTTNAQLRHTIANESLERGFGVEDSRRLISVRTGGDGYRVGPDTRTAGKRAKDEYRLLTRFLNNATSESNRLKKTLNFGQLYAGRENPQKDRERDAQSIQTAIDNLAAIKERILKNAS